jgi:hypothetical protein
MTDIVQRLRIIDMSYHPIAMEAANTIERLTALLGVAEATIEELEGFGKKSLYCYATDELLAELKRRASC